MRTVPISRVNPLLVTALLIIASGCVDLKPRPDNTRFFVLGSNSVLEPANATAESIIVGMKRVSLASYLDSPRIVTRIDDVEITYSSKNRWGEDLRVAIEDRLAALIRTSGSVRDVYTLPWPDRAKPQIRLTVHVERFEGDVSSEASLAASWSLSDSAGTMLRQGHLEKRIPGWVKGDYPGLIRKLDQALDAAADEIKTAIETLG